MLPTLLKEETMSPSISHSQLKFLLDENVKKDLLKLLSLEGYDAAFKPKGLSNGKLASLSKSEKRVFVTNDVDFSDSFLCPKDKIFSVVWLRIPQDKPEALSESFSNLLKSKNSPQDFEGNLIKLYEDKFEIEPLP